MLAGTNDGDGTYPRSNRCSGAITQARTWVMASLLG